MVITGLQIRVSVWPKTRPGPAEKTRPTRPKKRPGPAGAVHVSLLALPKTRPGLARVGPMDGGAFDVSTVNGYGWAAPVT